MFLGGLIVVSPSLKLSMIVPPSSSYVGFSSYVVFLKKITITFYIHDATEIYAIPMISGAFSIFCKILIDLISTSGFRAHSESVCGRDASMSGDKKQNNHPPLSLCMYFL